MSKIPNIITVAEFINGQLYINHNKWSGTHEETIEIMRIIRLKWEHENI